MKMIHQKLHQWYAENGRRDLPWRNTEDPYHIYLSEIMLQQTQVKTVLERYYFPFLEKFPTLKQLSLAPLDDVLKAWEGLGYYTRAKNLHKTAQITAPSLPTSYDALLALPGIGKNTASAICAFAYHQKRAVMEANVRRIICRIYALDDPKEDLLIAKAHGLLDVNNPYNYNQAMMDIGAIVCSVKNPNCGACPFASICQANTLACFDFPMKKSKKIPLRKENIMVQRYQNKIVLHQREGRFLHGLWGFKNCDDMEFSGVKVGMVKHQYTHFKLEVSVYVHILKNPTVSLFSKKDVEHLALSTVDKKIIKLLEKEGLF